MAIADNEIAASGNRAIAAVEALLRGLKPNINPFEVTVERLGSAIKMGLLVPGDQLPSEREIADLMGISRATVREAIRLLTVQGVLVVKRGRTGGTFVSEDLTSPHVLQLRRKLGDAGAKLAEILDHRLIIESGIAEIAAERAAVSQVIELQVLVEAMRPVEPDYQAYRRLDTRFHLLLAEATQSKRLQAAMADTHAELADMMLTVPHSTAACVHSTVQHQAIVRAIEEGNSDRARQVMKEHILATNSYLIGLL